MIGSFASGTTVPQVAKNGTKKLSQPFEELEGSNSEFKLITPRPITETYFETNLSSTNASSWWPKLELKNYSNVTIFYHNFALFRGTN